MEPVERLAVTVLGAVTAVESVAPIMSDGRNVRMGSMEVFSNSGQRLPVILIVDDIPENIVLMKRLLAPKGYDVHEATGGKAALETVLQDPPDVILLDLIMPDMNGFEVCERLKRDLSTRHIPVIIVTGMAEHEANIRALEAGADDFLTRPIDPVLLEARIRSSVKSKALQDQIMRYQRRLEDDNVALEERVRERTTLLERTQQVTVFSLARLAESRDPETGEHLDRMRRYVREIAIELGNRPKYDSIIDSGFIETLYYSSPLHDIGKVGIPDAILLKPGKLSVDEFDIMKTHALIGGDTLKAADTEAGGNSFLTMGRDIAYFHHEKWDGNGYPFGLKGTDIPLPARILALGDAYDALTSRRPYKEPFTHEVSRDIIVKAAGSHFDPEVVDAFLARENKFINIHGAFEDKGHPTHIEQVMKTLDRLHAMESDREAATKPAN
ncbi:MAG: HD domain-containing phosphohydrolase [Candidatus Hydrogenedentales bacterium]|jgi:putative two-component system response regulator